MSLVDELMGQLQNSGALSQIAGQLGTDQSQASSAISAALPMIVGALGNHAQSDEGASNVMDAVQQQGAAGGMDLGSIVGSVLGGQGGAGAAGMLGQIFGGNHQVAQEGLGQATGLSTGQSGALMSMLAPMVMGALANKVQNQGLDTGGLSAMLGQEHQAVSQQGGLGSSLLTSVLDQNGDGQLGLGDIVQLGAAFLSRR